VEGAHEKGSLYVKQKLARFVGRHESEEVGDVLSTAERFTDFIGNETIDPNLRGDGFRFYDAGNEDHGLRDLTDGAHGYLRQVVPPNCCFSPA